MKRIVIILFIISIAVSPAVAETDLSKLSFDELRQLQAEISKEIVTRPEWKEKIIPSGIWVVGKDIPAGDYSISMGDNVGAFIKIEDPTIEPSYNGLIFSEGITQPELTMGKITLLDGYVVTILHGPLKFAPAISLGF